MFGPKTVDTIIAALGRTVDELEVLAMQEQRIAANEFEEAARLNGVAEARLAQRDRAMRISERLKALVE